VTTPANFGDWQYEVYFRGLAGEPLGYPFEWEELERRAAAAVDPGPRNFVWGGAGGGDTMRANREAFHRWRIVPRMLRDVTRRDLRTTVLGTEMPAPVILAPVGVQTILHPDGEIASARAAAALGLPIVASTAAARSLEEVAQAAGDAPRWFQLYQPKDDDITRSLVARAERAGYGAIVMTLDSTLLGWRPADLGPAYLPFLRGTGIAQFVTDDVFRSRLARPPEEDMQGAVALRAQVINKIVTWDDVAFLRSLTKLPIVLKGILHPDDARLAREHSVDGVIVSNHGGRQVDGAIGALDALPGVVDAVGADMPVLFDSGIRCGADIVKALALGADAVLLGRPYLWGLALDGQAGVEAVLRMILAEFDLTLALSGYRTPAELGRESLERGEEPGR
jgi:isopentenyl diphosphate isomerase/L-lactate dehydrogenase-like FMN-dependent dehydrogenase